MTNTNEFWSGQGGGDYIARQEAPQLAASYTAMWAKILARTAGVDKVMELGANVGCNLEAIKWLIPGAKRYAVETNREACDILVYHDVNVVRSDIRQWDPRGERWDLVFTRGVLIHIPPDDLPAIYAKMYQASGKYIMVAEYYSPTPMEIEYQGQTGLLWKRDFAGDLMRLYPNLKLVDYGFCWRGDPNWPQDDVSWFLLEKA
jgi:pseudaminic acid biosynthesis-associated methylase